MAGRAHWVTATVTLALLGGVAVAQDSPRIEPRADMLLRLMSDTLADAKQFTVHNDQTSDEYGVWDDLVELSSSVDLAVRRPDQAHAVLHGDLRPMRYWLGGGRVAVLDESRWTYAVAPVPSGLDAAIDRLWAKYGIKIPLDDFISENVYEALTHNVESGNYVGLHEIDRVPCHHLAFRQSDIDWQIWIDDGLLPLPRKLLIVYKNEPGAPRYTARLSAWDLSPDLGDTIFEFEPAEGTEQIQFAADSEAVQDE
jgi:hypothetical protein